MSRTQAECLLAEVREERRRRLEVRCRASFYEFFVSGFTVLEQTVLERTPWIRAQCDTVQEWLEGWLVAQGRDKQGRPLKATPDMVERQAAHWKRELAGEPGGEALLAGDPWFSTPLVQDLIINGYPGSLKSRIAMVYALAWIWLHDPTFSMAATSGTSDNVARDSNLTKELVRSNWYRETFRIGWEVGVNRGGAVVDSQELWALSKGGYRLSKELYSSWQGVHVDLLGIDDPDDAAKVWGEADRKKARKKVVALRNRIAHPLKSLRLIVQQRVHPEDVTWHATSGGTWSPQHRKRPALLSIPLQFRPARRCRTPWGWQDPRTAHDEVSHPERYTDEFIDAERTAYGSAGFEAQYNQNPETTDGGWFKRLYWGFFVVEGHVPPVLRDRPEGCRSRADAPALPVKVLRDGSLDIEWLDLTIDASFGSLSDDASGVALTVVGGKGSARFIFLDDTKPRTFTQTEDAVRAIVAAWRWNRFSKLIVEAKAQGTAVMDRLRKAMLGLDPAIPPLLDHRGRKVTIPIEAVEPGTIAKTSRARSILPTQEAGHIHLLDGADWLPDWVDEASAFPFGRRDDRIDALAQDLNFRAEHGTATAQAQRDRAAIEALARMKG